MSSVNVNSIIYMVRSEAKLSGLVWVVVRAQLAGYINFQSGNCQVDEGPHLTMAEGREVVDFHQSDCKKPRIRPLHPSH